MKENNQPQKIKQNSTLTVSKMLSIIIPVYNDEKHIEKCLNAIYNSNHLNFEVIVIDDASTDCSAVISKKFPCNLICLNENMGVAHARNLGALRARGDILVFIDSDVVIEKDTLSRFENAHRKLGEKICQCQISYDSLNSGIAPNTIAIDWNYDYYCSDKYTSWVSTMACSIDRNTFLESGGFSEAFLSAGGEEFEIGEVFWQLNYKMYLDKSFKIHHHFQTFLPRVKTIFRRSYIYSNILLRRKFRFDNSRGTIKNIFVAGLSLALIILILFFPFSSSALLIFAIIFPLHLILNFKKNIYIMQKKGFFFLIKSLPITIIWNSSGFIGGMLAVTSFLIKKIIAPFRLFNFLFFKTPPYLILYLTSKCNAKCKHCFNWERLNNQRIISQELRFDEIEKISKNFHKIKYLTFSGGEPSLRQDTSDIAQLFYKYNNLEILNYFTNGLETKKIVSDARKILRNCPELYLKISISLNGLGEVHNNISGTKDGFNQILKTIEDLTKLQTYYPKLNLNITTVLSKFNKDSIFPTIDFITENLNLEMILSYVRGNPFEKNAKNIAISSYAKARDIVNNRNNKLKPKCGLQYILRAINNLNSQIVIQTALNKKRIIPCVVAKKLVVINECGDVFPCEMLPHKFGNLRDNQYDITKILNNKESLNFDAYLKEKKCFCTWECAIQNNILYNFSKYPSVLIETLKQIFC